MHWKIVFNFSLRHDLAQIIQDNRFLIPSGKWAES